MPNLSRHVLLRLLPGLPAAHRGRRRGLIRAAAMAAAPAALILVAGAGRSNRRARGGAAGTSPFPGAPGPRRRHGPPGRPPPPPATARTATGHGRRDRASTGRCPARRARTPPESGRPGVERDRRRRRARTGARTPGPAPSPSTWARSRSLSGLGITLDAASPSAGRDHPARHHLGPLEPRARRAATSRWTRGTRCTSRCRAGTQARYAQLTVYSGTGARVCVGEFRMFGPDPAAARMALGADLSFTPQELAAGAHFTDRGQPRHARSRSCGTTAPTTSGCGCG